MRPDRIAYPLGVVSVMIGYMVIISLIVGSFMEIFPFWVGLLNIILLPFPAIIFFYLKRKVWTAISLRETKKEDIVFRVWICNWLLALGFLPFVFLPGLFLIIVILNYPEVASGIFFINMIGLAIVFFMFLLMEILWLTFTFEATQTHFRFSSFILGTPPFFLKIDNIRSIRIYWKFVTVVTSNDWWTGNNYLFVWNVRKFKYELQLLNPKMKIYEY